MQIGGYKNGVKATGLHWEFPLGVSRGFLEEPGPRFVDPDEKIERKAIQGVEMESFLSDRFWDWWKSDRACTQQWFDHREDKLIHACQGKFQLFRYEWCNQIVIRCSKCGTTATPGTTGLVINCALPHNSSLVRKILETDRGYSIATPEIRTELFSESKSIVDSYWRSKKSG